MIRRVVPYGVALVGVGVVGAALGLAAWALRLPRIETFLLVFVLLAGAIAWRLGRGPAIAATLAFAVVSDYFFIEPHRGFGTETVGDTVHLVTGLLAAAAVIQFVHVARRHQVLLEKRKDLLQEVSPRIIQSLDADEVLNTVAEATLPVIDYQHFRVYRWDEAAERLVLVKSVARAEPYERIDWHTVTLSLGEGITGIAAQSRRPLLIPDGSLEPRMVYPVGTTPVVESILSVPMVTGDRLFGVLSLARLGARSLSDEDLRLMGSIAAPTALALANAEQYAAAGHPAGRGQGQRLPPDARRPALRRLCRFALAAAALVAAAAAPPAATGRGASCHRARYPAGSRAGTRTRRSLCRAGAGPTRVHADCLARAPHATDRHPRLRLPARGRIAGRDAGGRPESAPHPDGQVERKARTGRPDAAPRSDGGWGGPAADVGDRSAYGGGRCRRTRAAAGGVEARSRRSHVDLHP